MKLMAIVAVSCASAMAVSGCRDAGSAAGSEPPKIEVKAAVAPIDAVVVVAPIEGRIDHFAIAEGARVKKGDILLTVTNATVDRDLAYANAQLRASEARLRRAQTVPPARDAEAENAAREVLRNKEAKLERYRKLLASGDVSKQDLQDAETEEAMARRDWLAERERRRAAPAADDPEMIRAELDRARADVQLAETRKAMLTIVAPASGVAHLRMQPGDDVFIRDPVAEVRDPSTVRVQAAVAPELLRFMHAGVPVDVKVMTIPPRSFREPIVSVTPPGADGGGASIAVKVPNPDRMMQPGTPAVITIQ